MLVVMAFYRGLSLWTLDSEKEELIGEMTLPMPIATKGGSIGLNPRVVLSHELLGQPFAKDLAQIIVSMGLAQNFAALKAFSWCWYSARSHETAASITSLLAGAKRSGSS